MLTVMTVCVGIVGIFAYTSSAFATTAVTAPLNTIAANSGIASDPDAELPLFWLAPSLPTKLTPSSINGVVFNPATPGTALASVGNSGDNIPQLSSFPIAPGIALDPNDEDHFIVYNDNGLYVSLPERGLHCFR